MALFDLPGNKKVTPKTKGKSKPSVRTKERKSKPQKVLNFQDDLKGLNPDEKDIAEKIKRRRLQVLLHSCIYYELNKSIISDSTFDQWSKELADLQYEFPHVAKCVRLHEEFKDWDGSTGAFLPLRDGNLIAMAEDIIRSHERRGAR